MRNAITVAILAGGQSKRMGSDKSFVLLHGRPLIQHVIDRVTELNLPTIIVANDFDRYQTFGLPVFSDVLADKGSLGGIYTALCASQADAVLCLACDMPFLNPILLRHLIGLSGDADAVVPRVNDRPQGLHTLYCKACLPTIHRALEQDQLKIGDYLRLRRVRYVEETELRRFDPDFQSFTNINTPDELRRVVSCLGFDKNEFNQKCPS